MYFFNCELFYVVEKYFEIGWGFFLKEKEMICFMK